MNKKNFIMKEENGWFMMDAAALCFILMALAGTLGMYQSSLNSRNAAAMRMAAMHIAETQCSYLEEQAYSGCLSNGNIQWQGRPEDLTQNGIPMEVHTLITPGEEPLQQIEIKVTWNLKGKEESFLLERSVREHG